jgi:hypothetical protein
LKGDPQQTGQRGDSVFLNFEPEAAHLFDPHNGARL